MSEEHVQAPDERSGRRVAALGWAVLAGLLLLGVWIFAVAPYDRNMGFSQTILYIHVPSVWGAYLAFFVVFACSIAYLWKRDGAMDRVAKCSAEIGVLFCGLALATGSIWGRPTWGTYWVWDARLTTTLLLFLIYAGYVLLRAFAGEGERTARLAAVVGIVGFLDIPLVHLSVKWWRTLHQPTSMFKVNEQGAPEPAMPPELLVPLLTGIALVTALYAFLLLYRLRLEAREQVLAERLEGA